MLMASKARCYMPCYALPAIPLLFAIVVPQAILMRLLLHCQTAVMTQIIAAVPYQRQGSSKGQPLVHCQLPQVVQMRQPKAGRGKCSTC